MFFIHRNHLEIIKAMSVLSDALATATVAVQANTVAANALIEALAADKDAPAAVDALALAVRASTKVMTDALTPPAA